MKGGRRRRRLGRCRKRRRWRKKLAGRRLNHRFQMVLKRHFRRHCKMAAVVQMQPTAVRWHVRVR